MRKCCSWALPTIVELLQALQPDPAAQAFEQLLNAIIYGIEWNTQRELLHLWMSPLVPVIAKMQLHAVKHFRNLLPALLNAMEFSDDEAFQRALQVLDALLTHCWPRLVLHYTEINDMLKRSLQGRPEELQADSRRFQQRLQAVRQQMCSAA